MTPVSAAFLGGAMFGIALATSAIFLLARIMAWRADRRVDDASQEAGA